MGVDTFGNGFVSTGRLPGDETIQHMVEEAFDRYRHDREGSVSTVYPALERVSPDLFGICVVSSAGSTYSAGDVDREFTIMSISKPFVFALVCQQIGPEAAREKLGANSTGRPFNSVAAVDASSDGRTNPMVNSGAIMTTSLVDGADEDEKWALIVGGLSDFAGRELPLNDKVYASAKETNQRNRGLSLMLQGLGLMYSDPLEATDLYTRQCCLNVTARDLAVMGATLADGGVNPITGKRVVDASVCHYTLATMVTAGMYETSGDWFYDVGLPGKSGIGGGIVTVSPGKGGLGTFATRLDQMGNSVKGQLACKHLSRELGMDLLVSSPQR